VAYSGILVVLWVKKKVAWPSFLEWNAKEGDSPVEKYKVPVKKKKKFFFAFREGCGLSEKGLRFNSRSFPKVKGGFMGSSRVKSKIATVCAQRKLKNAN